MVNNQPDKKKATARCACPFCEEDIDPSSPFCRACGVKVSYCTGCRAPIPAGADACPVCGTRKGQGQKH